MSKCLSFRSQRFLQQIRQPLSCNRFEHEIAYADKDHAKVYAEFRPQPPELLVNKVLEFLKMKIHQPLQTAVDIGCGSGQATKMISPFFDKVVGFDCSKAQIEEANNNNRNENVEFRVSSAEQLPMKDATVDLVIACEAVHWFNIPKFFEEVHRILVPCGVVAIAGYAYPEPWYENEEISFQLQELIVKLFTRFEYLWPPTHSLLFNHYKDIIVPYKEAERIEAIPFVVRGSLHNLIGHLNSRSGFQALKKSNPKLLNSVMKQFETDFKKIVNSKADNKHLFIDIQYNYFLILARKPSVELMF